MAYNNFLLRLIFGSIFTVFIFVIIIFYDTYLSYLVLLIYSIILIEVSLFFTKKKIIIILYIFLSFLSLEYYLINSYNKIDIIYLILLIIFFDTFSYIFGSLFGNKKIIPNISPNKTYFGCFSGYFISIILTYIILSYYKNYELLNYLFISSLLILLAFIGDIIESYFKRKSNIKNSSFFLPGHGGFFDRLDSLILCAFLMPFIVL